MSSPEAGDAAGFAAGVAEAWGSGDAAGEAAGVGPARGGGVASVAGVTAIVGDGEAPPVGAPIWAIRGEDIKTSRIRK